MQKILKKKAEAVIEENEVVVEKKRKSSTNSSNGTNGKSDNKLLNKKTKKAPEVEPDSEEEEIVEPKKVNKKKKVEPQPEPEESEEEVIEPKKTVKKGYEPSAPVDKVPFKRISDDYKNNLTDDLADNSYEAFMRTTGENFGREANEKLRVTKGRDFKKEKTKFKNKTAFGGTSISMAVRSIKLEDDSD